MGHNICPFFIYLSMMIVVNREKVKRMLRQGLAFILVIGLAAGYRVVYPGETGITTTGNAGEVINWGLSFDKEGEPPVGNASASELSQYDAWYVGDTSKKTIYLTFDAGFENGYTAEILDTLKQHKVPAAFFLVGTYIRDNPKLVKRMAAEGHIVGNHSMNHRDMSAVSDEAVFQKELAEVEMVYQLALGDGAGAASGGGKSGEKKVKMPKYYRPPEGRFSPQNLKMAKNLGYKTVFWSLAYVDWYEDKQPTKEEAFDKLLNRIHPGAIVLLHNTSQTNGEIMDELLTKWEDMGYTFAPITELFK